jgi:hypothetical protein
MEVENLLEVGIGVYGWMVGWMGGVFEFFGGMRERGGMMYDMRMSTRERKFYCNFRDPWVLILLRKG